MIHVRRRAAWLTLFLCASGAVAHEIRPAVVTVTLSDARYRIEIVTNLEALLAGIGPQHPDTDESPNARYYDTLRALRPQELRQRFEEFGQTFLSGVTLEFDGERVTPRIAGGDIPEVGDTGRARLSTIYLDGEIPPGAETIRWTYAERFGSSVLRLQRAGDTDVLAVWLKDGARSEAYPVHGVRGPPSRAAVAMQYTALGFSHILPKGLDHILFVLGLFLLSLRIRPLLVQVTAFTVAHTITLALTIYGVFSLSPAIVEPLIAVSIVYVAIENMLTSRLMPWRAFVVFGFGLLHGMGFAGVLNELGLPDSEFLTALITFNLGVELGQLAVIALAYLAVGVWWKDRPWYRHGVVLPGSALIALTGLYWTVERLAV